jgi:hypothetical protein
MPPTSSLMRTLTRSLKIWKSPVFKPKNTHGQSQASRGLIPMHQARSANTQMQPLNPIIYLWMMASSRQLRASAILVSNLQCQRQGEIPYLSRLRFRVLNKLRACAFNHNYRPPRLTLSNLIHLRANSLRSRSGNRLSDSQESISNRILSRSLKSSLILTRVHHKSFKSPLIWPNRKWCRQSVLSILNVPAPTFKFNRLMLRSKSETIPSQAATQTSVKEPLPDLKHNQTFYRFRLL